MTFSGIPIRISSFLYKKQENQRRTNRTGSLFFSSHPCLCKPLLQCHFFVSGPLVLFIEILNISEIAQSSLLGACVCVCVCVCVVAQSCLTLCDPMDCSPPGSSLHRIFQARILEWVANSYSRGSCQTQVSNTRLFATEPPGKPLSFRYCFIIMIFQRGIFFSLAHRQMTAPDCFSP